MSQPDRRRRLAVLTTGGTVAMIRPDGAAGAVLPAGGDDFAAAVRRAAPGCAVDIRSVCARASVNIGLGQVAALLREVRRRVAEGCDGVVVTHGTDTLEETAFALDLLYAGTPTLVFTGALRTADAPGADGPANLAAAALVALDPGCRGAGVLVVMNEEIHAARLVRKAHASNLAAFASDPCGPLGGVSEGRPALRLRPADALPRLTLGRRRPHVPILSPAADTPPAWLAAAGRADGLVIDLPGGGHAPERLGPTLAALARRRPVVFASRTGAGETLRSSYGYPGGEMDLLRRGLIGAGRLDARKARVALSLLLSAGQPPSEIAAWFAAANGEGPAGLGSGGTGRMSDAACG